MKKDFTEWEKIFASYFSDRALLFKYYKELKNFTTKSKTTKTINGQINRYFSKEKNTNDNQIYKKISTFLSIKKVQIKTTLTFYLIPVRMVANKNINKNQ